MHKIIDHFKGKLAEEHFRREYLKQNLSTLLHALLIGSAVVTAVGVLSPWLAKETPFMTFAGFLSFLFLLRLNRRGHSFMAGFIVVVIMLLMANFGMYIGRGFRDESMLIFPGLVALASLILNRYLFLFFATLTIVNVVLIGILEITGYFVHPLSNYTNAGEVIAAATILSVTATVVYVLNNNLISTIQRAQKSEHHFRSFFDSNPDGIVITDFDGNIQQVNRTVVKMFGYAAPEAVDRNFTEFIPASDAQQLQKILHNLVRGISPGEPYETEIVNKDGRTIPVLLKGWLVRDPESKPLAVGSFIKDISEKRDLMAAKSLLEDQLFHIQKIEAIGTLAGGIAHDFNNILVGVIGYAELALGEVTRNQLLRDYVLKIREAGLRARELVRQILKFSRREKFELGPLSLGTLVREVMKLARSTFPASVRIEMFLSAEPDIINGDPNQIHQVLMNLCTNALHAMKDKEGILSIHLDNYQLETAKQYLNMQILPGRYIRIQVADNGIGITPDILSRVFEPYFTTKEVDEGTGLGLSVTMGIVQSHNGLIEVSSTPGVGTIFSIYLPELQEQKSVISKTAVTGHTGNGERVLVLDDEDFFVSIMRDYLIHMNYQPSVFRDPLEALAELRQHGSDYDLVVTDLSMPGLSGIEFISEIKKMGIDIPIMLCTGFSDKITEETAQYYGITKFLLKPVSKTDIENALFEVFKKEGS